MSTIVTDRDLQLQQRLLEHGIIFPPAFKDRLRELILEGVRRTSFKHMQSGSLMQGSALVPDGGNNVNWGSGFHTGPDTGYVSFSPARKKTGIADGRYLLIFGVSFASSTDYYVGMSVNGDTPVDTEALLGHISTLAHVREITLKTGNNNSLEMKVKIPAALSGTFDNSFVSLLRLGSV